jgi:hypothetical protein
MNLAVCRQLLGSEICMWPKEQRELFAQKVFFFSASLPRREKEEKFADVV